MELLSAGLPGSDLPCKDRAGRLPYEWLGVFREEFHKIRNPGMRNLGESESSNSAEVIAVFLLQRDQASWRKNADQDVNACGVGDLSQGLATGNLDVMLLCLV